MAIKIDTRYPSVDDLRNKARKKIPKFAFEYLDGGCNEDVNLIRNISWCYYEKTFICSYP